jgi:hypothetical protein
MKLFRAMSPAEWADIQKQSEFRPGPPSFQGKWFAETLIAAITWGSRLHLNSPDGFVVIEVDVPRAIADSYFRLPLLEGIGPARFVAIDELDSLKRLPCSCVYTAP